MAIDFTEDDTNLTCEEARNSSLNAFKHYIICNYDNDIQSKIITKYAVCVNAYLEYKKYLLSLEHFKFAKLVDIKKILPDNVTYDIIRSPIKPCSVNIEIQMMTTEYREILRCVKHRRVFMVSMEIVKKTDFVLLRKLMLDYFVYLNRNRLTTFINKVIQI